MRGGDGLSGDLVISSGVGERGSLGEGDWLPLKGVNTGELHPLDDEDDDEEDGDGADGRWLVAALPLGGLVSWGGSDRLTSVARWPAMTARCWLVTALSRAASSWAASVRVKCPSILFMFSFTSFVEVCIRWHMLTSSVFTRCRVCTSLAKCTSDRFSASDAFLTSAGGGGFGADAGASGAFCVFPVALVVRLVVAGVEVLFVDTLVVGWAGAAFSGQ